jgi:uncharacterized protein with FMN-binding domain
MKKIIWSLLATITGVVLLFSYRTSLEAVAPVSSSDTTGTGATGTGATGTGVTGSGATGSGTAGSGTEATTPSPSAPAPSPSTTSTPVPSTGASSLKDGTFSGSDVDTPYGPVQVAITVAGGRVTAVRVPQYPQDTPRDQEINARAIPQLISETKSAQSAQIDMVSGATYTSDGYLRSLQSALDQAR